MGNTVQLLGISNAIVDVLAHVDHELIEEIGIVPGSMNLIDKQRAEGPRIAGFRLKKAGFRETSIS